MEELGERPVWSMNGGEMLAALDQVEADLARRQTYRLQLVAGLDGIGHAQEIGAHDTAQLLAFRYRIDPAQARRDLRLALALPKYADVSAALPATGEPAGPRPADDPADDSAQPEGVGASASAEEFLRPAQAEAIVSALERVPSTVPVEDIVVAEQQLVNLARHLSPGELRRAGQRIRDILDTDGPEPDERKAYDRESLTLSAADRGVKFRGYLANENAELLRSLIHAGARPHKTHDGELDPRPREKRQADALTTALTLAAKATDTTQPAAKPAPSAPADADTTATDAETTATDARTTAAAADTTASTTGGDAATVAPTAAAATGRSPRASDPVPGHGAKATITVTIDLQDLKAATADATGDLVYGDGLSAAAIRRLACDAKIIPLVLGSNSEPLDVGRSERLVTRAMRRALNARDKGCVVCGAPPIQCDAHHLQSWIDGGETSIWNLVLLCRRHHIDLHAGHWTITITNGVVHVARPTWADPPPTPPTRPTPLVPERSALNSSPAQPAKPVATVRPATATPVPATGAPDATSNPAPVAATGSDLPSTREDAENAVRFKGPPDAATNPRPVSSGPWGATVAERPSRPGVYASRETLEEAVRFAVWGSPPAQPARAPAPRDT